MKKKIEIPDDYFEDQEFVIDELDEDFILGILGPTPAADQILKFELCTYISHLIDKKGLSLTDAEKITGVNTSDISRIKNHHLDRFTIDRLIRIYSFLASEKSLGAVLKSASEKIGRLSA